MPSHSWIWLLAAICFGALGTISLKVSEGLKKWKPIVFLMVFYSISFAALTFALQGIDVSIVYAIWSGVGTILVAIIGVIIFGESISLRKIFSLILIVIGVLGIQYANLFH